jgi:hypothetical protein
VRPDARGVFQTGQIYLAIIAKLVEQYDDQCHSCLGPDGGAMTWRDKLEIGLKENASYRKDNLPLSEVIGPELPQGAGRSAEIPHTRGTRIQTRTRSGAIPARRKSRRRSALFTALLAVVIGSSSLGAAQGSDDWAIDQAQRAVQERIANREGERDVFVRFARDARTESALNTSLRVRGTGSVVRSRDGKARPFTYEAVVNTHNSEVSDIHYDWRGDWAKPVANRLTGGTPRPPAVTRTTRGI